MVPGACTPSIESSRSFVLIPPRAENPPALPFAATPRCRRSRSAYRTGGSRDPSRRSLPPLADLGGVLAVVPGAGAVERIPCAAARREVRVWQRRGRADEAPVAEVQLGEDVGRLHARLPVDEPRIPRIEIIIRSGRVGRRSACDVRERGDHRIVPPGDVNGDLSDAPAPEPYATHL